MRQKLYTFLLVCLSMTGGMPVLTSCRQEITVRPGETEQHGEKQLTAVAGFYLLCEGNMGSNKATLDYYDYATATYRRDIYAAANPTVVKELGDVGNDLQVYGGRLYAVINASNKVEVMDVQTCKRIGQVDIPNCRYITFHGKYAYVSSYSGPVQIKPDYEQRGYVARFDTATLQVDAQCLVGYQPDELEIVGNTLFVANSGGYMAPNYDNTLSVISLASFTETLRLPVAMNLHRVRADRYGQLWVSSRGNYHDVPARLYCIDQAAMQVKDSLPVCVSDMCIVGDSLYFCATDWSYVEMRDEVGYGIVNVRTRQLITDNVITDGTAQQLKKPYGLAVNPATREIYVTDAKDYVTPGTLYCFSPAGKQLWQVRTGDIPAHIAFVAKRISALPDTASAATNSPYISRVWEYCPAPGQFVNELPLYEPGDDAEAMRRKADEAIAANARHTITLGGWGGYVVFGFDHPVQNVAGEYDLQVLGNAFYSDMTRPEIGGSAEPGIVYVSRDDNGNGLPDDTWYELAGSEISRSDRTYQVTYFRTPDNHVPTPDVVAALTDTTYIRWQDNCAQTGYIAQNSYHTQPYYPQWQAERLTLTGTLLPANAVAEEVNGSTQYVLMNYAYGYADNHPNNVTASHLKIDWAVDEQGNSVSLEAIDFVKVQTGIHQQCGRIGETSTEVLGAVDLHVKP